MQLGTHLHLSGSNPKVLLTDWWVPQCFPRRNGKDSVEMVEVEEVVVVDQRVRQVVDTTRRWR